uniref:ER membrane protein complex subunit 1 n=1 Tax=Globodera rostochiensis TaxID=31243 RepID=A0A914HSV6_GLORO
MHTIDHAYGIVWGLKMNITRQRTSCSLSVHSYALNASHFLGQRFAPNTQSMHTIDHAYGIFKQDSIVLFFNPITGFQVEQLRIPGGKGRFDQFYWNDKARRTEVGVVELFEGLQQTVFDSLTAHSRPVQVAIKTYIFSQGINAMAATSIEQGLTSQTVLVAQPFGGILEAVFWTPDVL